jgi:hypothetical protein
MRARYVEGVSSRDDLREFLTTRRARNTPQQAGLHAYGAKRRVAGLRREEVAMLAGISVAYYSKLGRGNARGASEAVLVPAIAGSPQCRSSNFPR